jgi:hypothetical protein
VVTQDSSQRRLGIAAAKPIKKKEKIRQHGAKNVFYLLPSSVPWLFPRKFCYGDAEKN